MTMRTILAGAATALLIDPLPAVAQEFVYTLGVQQTPSGVVDAQLGAFNYLYGNTAAIAGGPATVQGTATAQADVVKLGATARIDAQPSLLTALPASDLVACCSAQGILQLFRGQGRTIDTLAPATSFTAMANLFSDRTVGLSLAASHSAYELRMQLAPFVDADFAANGFHDGFLGYETLHLGSLAISAAISASIVDSAPCLVDICGASLTRILFANQNFYAVIPQSDPTQWDIFSTALSYDYIATGTLYAAGGAHWVYSGDIQNLSNSSDRVVALNGSGNDGFDIDLTGGHTYEVTQTVDCETSMSGAAYFLSDTSANCDASHSLYWNGLTDARDPAGNPVAVPALHSASGFDYRYASPLSPVPAVVAPPVASVPEPATWTLLIAGFGAVGAAARRRRTATVAA